MENASKALIIAGAILLSILLISLGIMIFNQAQDVVNNSGMTEAELTAFNNKFLKYEGTISGSEAKALMSEIIASNSDESNQDLDRVIDIFIVDDEGAEVLTVEPSAADDGDYDSLTYSTSGIKTTDQYEVELGYSGQGGRVNKITLTEQ